MIPSFLLVLSTGLSFPVMDVGPLIEQAPAGVCTAFVGKQGVRPVLYTAAHCLKKEKTKLWLPGLEGNAAALQNSKWTHVSAFSPTTWRVVPGRDLAWAPLADRASPSISSPMPSPGDRLVVLGYPEGRGVQRLECVYRGVALLDDEGVARPRPEMDCGQPTGFRRHTGFSGGPVLSQKGGVVGVLVSGTVSSAGAVRLGFEPLSPWLTEGWSRHRASLAWETPEPQRLEMRVSSGRLVEYRLVSPQGVVWTRALVASPQDAATLAP